MCHEMDVIHTLNTEVKEEADTLKAKQMKENFKYMQMAKKE